MRVLLIMPPMTQVNTPYPATAFLTGFLRSREVDAVQADLSIELIDRIFSRAFLERLATHLNGDGTSFRVNLQDEPSTRLGRRGGTASPGAFRVAPNRYLDTIDPTIDFLRGKNPQLAKRIVNRRYLPEGLRFAALRDESGSYVPLQRALHDLSEADQAKHLASLYLFDVADLIREEVDPRFELSRYAEKLAISAPSFAPLQAELSKAPTWLDDLLRELAEAACERHQPDLVGITSPFPGNVYAAFRIAQTVRRVRPQAKIAWGGGYPNTELRELKEPRVFDYFDYVCLDSGEQPLLCILDHLSGKRPEEKLCRTYTRRAGRVVYHNDPTIPPIAHSEIGVPTYDGLPLDKYLSLIEMINPMHRLWSDGRWNKLMVAHGCYWSQCTFCDTKLDYIERFSKAPASMLADRMESLIRETGERGFHFVDEAAPPAALKRLAEELIQRGVEARWWGNIRFDTYFTKEVCQLLAQSGCIAVSGGLEVAEDRLLALIKKGVTVEQVARVTRNFTDAGIMVHAYLMYGYPTQTVQETVNALELVRQLFAADCIQSGFWHRFALTAHSPIACDPAAFGIELLPEPEVTFARNEIPFHDPVGADHDMLGVGLRKSLYNFMHGVGLDEDVRAWFPAPVPRPTVRAGLVERALQQRTERHGLGRGGP